MNKSLKEFLTGYKGKEMPKELKDFNWGAFLLTFIWGIKHRAWITILAIPLIIIQLPLGINWLLYTALQFYCGFKGNMWAYQNDWWMTPKDFRKNQMKWAIVAIAINITVPIILLGTAILFVNKSPDNPTEFIKNTQCYIAASKINKSFKNVSLNSSTTEKELAQSFAKQFSNATTDDSRVNFSVKHSGKNIDVYYIEFSMYGDDNCSLKKRNCSIKSSFILPDEINFNSDCDFYFNLNKQVVPAQQTKNRLKKGINIFKYL